MRLIAEFSRAKSAFRGVLVAVLAGLACACTHSIAGSGLGGPTVTRVDTSELPGPQGQTGREQVYVARLGPLDKLVIDVMDLPDMADRHVSVDGGGYISLPIAGAVEVGGLTLQEAGDRISQQLRAGFVRDPRVSINVEESRSNYVTVDGEVQQAGNYPVLPGLTLMRAVAGARGTTEFAKLREVVIHRTVNGRQMIALYDLAAIRSGAYSDPVLYPNDVVVVGNSPGRRLLQQVVAVAPLFLSPLVTVLNNN